MGEETYLIFTKNNSESWLCAYMFYENCKEVNLISYEKLNEIKKKNTVTKAICFGLSINEDIFVNIVEKFTYKTFINNSSWPTFVKKCIPKKMDDILFVNSEKNKTLFEISYDHLKKLFNKIVNNTSCSNIPVKIKESWYFKYTNDENFLNGIFYDKCIGNVDKMKYYENETISMTGNKLLNDNEIPISVYLLSNLGQIKKNTYKVDLSDYLKEDNVKYLNFKSSIKSNIAINMSIVKNKKVNFEIDKNRTLFISSNAQHNLYEIANDLKELYSKGKNLDINYISTYYCDIKTNDKYLCILPLDENASMKEKFDKMPGRKFGKNFVYITLKSNMNINDIINI